jgi:hypothetical protein
VAISRLSRIPADTRRPFQRSNPVAAGRLQGVEADGLPCAARPVLPLFPLFSSAFRAYQPEPVEPGGGGRGGC